MAAADRRPMTPGPGNYNIPTTMQQRPVSMTPRHDAKQRPMTSPGPGAYETQRTLGGAKFSMPKTPRLTTSKYRMVSPGPGAYESYQSINNPKNPVIGNPPKFSIVPKRAEIKSKMETPGPTLNFTTFGV